MLDYLGRASVIGDFENSTSVSGKFAAWLFTTPAWVPGVLAGFITLVWLIITFKSFMSASERVGATSPVATAGSDTYTKISDLPILKVKTSLRLQFRGGEQAPTMLSFENILFWRAIWAGSITLTAQSEDGSRSEETRFPKTWVIFIVFNKPTIISQFIVQPGTPDFPTHEVRFSDSYSAVVTTFGDDPPSCIVDFYAAA